MSPQTRSKSKRSDEKNVPIYIQQFRQNASNTTSNAESSAQAAARDTTTLKKRPISPVTKKMSANQFCKKFIEVSHIEQEPEAQVPKATIATTTNGANEKTQIFGNDNYNDQDSSGVYEQDNIEHEPDENQQAQFDKTQNNFCFKGEGKFYIKFPLPVFSAGISDTSTLLCGNKSNTFAPMISTMKHHQHNKICDDTKNISSYLKDDINRILENLRDMLKTIKTLTGRNKSYCKRGYSAISDNYEQQQEEEHIPKRPRRAQSEDSEDGSLFSEVSSRVLELRDQIKKGEKQLNSLHNQYRQLEKLYHEAFGVIHCNNKIARNAAVIQFSHKANTIASNVSSLWNSSDKLDRDSKQLVDIFMDESFEGEEGGYTDT